MQDSVFIEYDTTYRMQDSVLTKHTLLAQAQLKNASIWATRSGTSDKDPWARTLSLIGVHCLNFASLRSILKRYPSDCAVFRMLRVAMKFIMSKHVLASARYKYCHAHSYEHRNVYTSAELAPSQLQHLCSSTTKDRTFDIAVVCAFALSKHYLPRHGESGKKTR